MIINNKNENEQIFQKMLDNISFSEKTVKAALKTKGRVTLLYDNTNNIFLTYPGYLFDLSIKNNIFLRLDFDNFFEKARLEYHNDTDSFDKILKKLKRSTKTRILNFQKKIITSELEKDTSFQFESFLQGDLPYESYPLKESFLAKENLHNFYMKQNKGKIFQNNNNLFKLVNISEDFLSDWFTSLTNQDEDIDLFLFSSDDFVNEFTKMNNEKKLLIADFMNNWFDHHSKKDHEILLLIFRTLLNKGMSTDLKFLKEHLNVSFSIEEYMLFAKDLIGKGLFNTESTKYVLEFLRNGGITTIKNIDTKYETNDYKTLKLVSNIGQQKSLFFEKNSDAVFASNAKIFLNTMPVPVLSTYNAEKNKRWLVPDEEHYQSVIADLKEDINHYQEELNIGVYESTYAQNIQARIDAVKAQMDELKIFNPDDANYFVC